MALLILALLSSAAFADTTYDTVSGTCETFNDHVRNRGLKDADGNTHLNTLGWTSCRFKASLPGKGVKVREMRLENERCAVTSLRRARFESNQTVIVMRWEHKRPTLTAACGEELAKVERAILDHEASHVADCKAIASETAAAWRKSKHLLQVCGQGDLSGKIQAKIEDELKDQLNRMNREMEYRTRATHERIGYGSSGINCRKCAD